MEWILAVLGGGGAALAGRYLWDRRRARQRDLAELLEVRRLAEEDVTLLGEELSRLGVEVEGRELDPETRLDYRAALEAYEAAALAAADLHDVDGISTVADMLATGRYLIVCVRARLAGRPVPERRVPCFFNPQHGPSSTDVVWNQPAHGTRRVPACAQDAARIQAGQEPEVRYVRYNGQRVPYWQAGPAAAPYRK